MNPFRTAFYRTLEQEIEEATDRAVDYSVDSIVDPIIEQPSHLTISQAVDAVLISNLRRKTILTVPEELLR